MKRGGNNREKKPKHKKKTSMLKYYEAPLEEP